VGIVKLLFFALEGEVSFLDLLAEETASVLFVQFTRGRFEFGPLFLLLPYSLFWGRCRAGRGGRASLRSGCLRGRGSR